MEVRERGCGVDIFGPTAGLFGRTAAAGIDSGDGGLGANTDAFVRYPKYSIVRPSRYLLRWLDSLRGGVSFVGNGYILYLKVESANPRKEQGWNRDLLLFWRNVHVRNGG